MSQPLMYTYPSSPKLPSHLGCLVTRSRVPCAIQQVFVGYPFYFILFIHLFLLTHFKSSSVYVSISKSPTIPSPSSSERLPAIPFFNLPHCSAYVASTRPMPFWTEGGLLSSRYKRLPPAQCRSSRRHELSILPSLLLEDIF